MPLTFVCKPQILRAGDLRALMGKSLGHESVNVFRGKGSLSKIAGLYKLIILKVYLKSSLQ